MKQQLGTMLTAAVLLYAPLAWSQTSDTSSSQTSSSNSSPGLFTNSGPTGWTDSPQNGSSDSGQSDSGQSGSGDQSQSGASGPQDTFSHPEQLPALNLFSDVVSRTGISLTTSVGTLAQHVTGEGPNTWEALSSFNGGLTMAQIRPMLTWSLGYIGGVNLTSGISNYNYTNLNQAAYANIKWNFAKRWQMRIKDNYFYSDDPFQPFFTYLGQPTPNNPNPVVYYPQAVIEQNQATADLTYQLGPHDVLNFEGVEGFQRYLRSTVSSLWNSVTYSGSAFYQHEFSQRLAAGGGYQFAALDFGHGSSRAGVQTFQGFITYVFSSRLQVSGWIGPQQTSTKDIVPVFCYQFGCFYAIQHQQTWSVAQGGTVRWKATTRDLFGLDFSHGVSNGGGILGAATIYQATLTYSRPVSRLWSFGMGLYYVDSNSISSFRNPEFLKSITGTLGFSRKLFDSDAWSLNAYYAFIHQSENYTGLPDVISTSGLGFTIRYSWDHGFGR